MAVQPYWREGADPHVARCQFRALQSSHGEPTILVAVVMISLNEARNMEGVVQNLKGWAQEVFLVDSYSGV